MKLVYYDYDIYPKVFLANQKKQITVQPLSANRMFDKNKEYTVKIYKVNQSNPGAYSERSGRVSVNVVPDDDVDAVFLEGGDVGVDGLPLTLDAPLPVQHIDQFRCSHGVRLVGVSLQVVENMENLQLLIVGFWHREHLTVLMCPLYHTV